jgi:hypothetical protein
MVFIRWNCKQHFAINFIGDFAVNQINMTQEEFDWYVDYAVMLYESDYIPRDIRRYLKVKGADKQAIKAIMKAIRKAEKTEARRIGLKYMIWGLGTLGLGMLLTWLTYNPHSAYVVFPYGMLIVGCSLFFRGFVNIF